MTIDLDALDAGLPEWNMPRSNAQPSCPWCGAYKQDGHRDGCPRAAHIATIRQLVAVARAAAAVCVSPLHTPEMEPTTVFDDLRAALKDAGL
jgi:hypothetical protein